MTTTHHKALIRNLALVWVIASTFSFSPVRASAIPTGSAVALHTIPVRKTGQITAANATVIDTTKPSTYRTPQAVPPAPKTVIPARELAAAKTTRRAMARSTAKKWAGSVTPAPRDPPTNLASFEGINVKSCCPRPPDTHGAVGLNHFVEATNGMGLSIFEKWGGALVRSTTLDGFFKYADHLIFHPRVVYDRTMNRWVIFAESLPRDASFQFVFLAVSKTSNPLGEYWKFAFDVPETPGDYFDYPQLGMNKDALIITGNVFTGDTYVRSRAFGIPKNAAYNGRGWNVPYFDLGTPGTVAPPIVEDNNTNAYLLAANPAADQDNLKLFRATNLGLNNTSIVFQSVVPVSWFYFPPDARQPRTDNLLDTMDGRFQNTSTQIGDQLLNIHTVSTDAYPTFPTPRWYQINTTNNAVAARGHIFRSIFSDDFNAAIVGSPVGGTDTNPIGRMFFAWTSTEQFNPDPWDAPRQASVVVSGRLASDPSDVCCWWSVTALAVARTFYDPSPDPVESWGAYSAIAIDPVGFRGCPVGQRAWLVNERQINTTAWGSLIGRIGYC
jgi:hypothetical protein